MKRHLVFPQRVVCPHSPFAVCAVIEGIPDTERRFLTKAECRSTIVSSHCSLPGIIFVNCYDPTAILRAVGDLVSPSTSQISELSFTPARRCQCATTAAMALSHDTNVTVINRFLCAIIEGREDFSRAVTERRKASLC